MKLNITAAFAASCLLLAPSVHAAKPAKEEAKDSTPSAPAKAKVAPATGQAKSDGKAIEEEDDGKCCDEVPKRTWFPNDAFAGNFTLGTMFSDDAAGIYLDGITGIWASEKRDAYFFLAARYHWEDNDQFISSTGVAFRKQLPGRDVIIGANVFYDALHSQHGNDYAQLGLGVELLTKWVDARFNYYLPEDDRYEIGRRTSRSTNTSLSLAGITKTSRRDHFKTYEGSLEGFNGEVGFLIPGLDRFAEVRAFAGFYHYENPFGGDFDGFKGRLEARLLRGVTANVEYWDDKELMGGHWTGEIAVSVPFSLYNLFTGKNPFEGAGDSFKRLPRNFNDRMGDMIERSHRIQTVASGEVRTDRSHSRRFTPYSSNSGGGGGSSSGGPQGFPIE